MSEYIVDMPGSYNRDGIYYPDERHSGIQIMGELVRCRDCRHFTPKGTHVFSDGTVNDDFCHYIRSWLLPISSGGFCAWGEKKAVS